jgi:tetratricopeptide (TPR) repeat protein
VSKAADAPKQSSTRFVLSGIEPLEAAGAPRVPGDLVRKGKTPFVTPEIAPAEPPAALQPAPDEVAVEPAPTPATKPESEPVAEPHAMPIARGDDERTAPLQQGVPFAKTPPRTPEVTAAVARASAKVRHGFELAERGALYAARADFADALKFVAQAYDAQQTERSYGKALAAGLAALKESADFIRQSQSLQDVSIANIVLPHSTPVLKDADLSTLTLADAAQCYYTYAQEQLSAATAGEMCGSMALYGMGRVAVVVGRSSGQQIEHIGQAVALFRAALIAEPRNFRAANELGVLLAENGQLELARDMLIRSVSVTPQVTTWRNLAVVHKRTGQQNLAQHAEAQAMAMQRAGHGVKNEPAVEWVDPATFASTKPATDNHPPAVVPKTDPAATSASAQAKPQEQPTSVAKKGIAEWLGLSPRR